MNDNLLEYRKQAFAEWIDSQISIWLHEYGAWDDRIEDEDDDFNEEDWDFIRNNLRVTNITIEEIK